MSFYNIKPPNNNSILTDPALSHYNITTTNSASITTTAPSNKNLKTSGPIKIAEREKKDYKLERIIKKFRMGKKLTPGELSYVARKAPDMYQKIVAVMQRREQLEKRLAAATEEEAAQIISQEMGSIENILDDFEKEATANQLREAYKEYLSNKPLDAKEDEDKELNGLEELEELEESEEYDEFGLPSNKKKRHSINIRV